MKAVKSALSSWPKPRVLLLAGPTASGKTDLSIQFAKFIQKQQQQNHNVLKKEAEESIVEVISSDTVQMYKECNIASNKITEEQRQGVTHHLIDSFSLEQVNLRQMMMLDQKDNGEKSNEGRDICESNIAASAGWFCRQVKKLSHEITSRKHIPMIVGGSGFYNELLFKGTQNSSMSAVDGSGHRLSLEQKIQNVQQWKNTGRSWDELVAELESKAPELARSITRNNYTRLYRAFEKIQQQSNAKKGDEANENSAWHADENDSSFIEPNLDPVFGTDTEYDVRCIVLYVDRFYLYDYIGLRCERLIESGLIEETFDLLQRGLLTKNTVPYSAIGYKQAISFIQQCQQQMDVLGSLSEEWLTKAFLEFLQEFKTVTRNYAKKQYSWFRRVPDGRNETHPPPHYMWLDVNHLFQTILNRDRESAPEDTDESQLYNEYIQKLYELLTMSREDYECILNSESNKQIAQQSKINSAILLNEFTLNAQQNNNNNSNMAPRRRVLAALDQMAHKLHVYQDEQALALRLSKIRDMFLIK